MIIGGFISTEMGKVFAEEHIRISVIGYIDQAGLNKHLILSHHKNFIKGDYLIDDQPKHGAETFEGEWIQFGSERFPDWPAVVDYLDSM